MIPPDLDLKKLPAKPVIDGANYDWTGRLGDYPCLLNGHVELDRQSRPPMLDTRPWGKMQWAGAQVGRAERYMRLARSMGDMLLVYIFEDKGRTSDLQGTPKRGGKRFTGLFRVVEFPPEGFLAQLVRRD
jgi:hypothetical protein